MPDNRSGLRIALDKLADAYIEGAETAIRSRGEKALADEIAAHRERWAALFAERPLLRVVAELAELEREVHRDA